MKHEAIYAACSALELNIAQTPDPRPTVKRYVAKPDGKHAPSVYWSTSSEGGLLGLPRVITKDGHDTHARTIKEIKYLVKL